MLPLILFVIIRAKVAHLHCHVAFIADFGSNEMTEASILARTLEASLVHIGIHNWKQYFIVSYDYENDALESLQ